MIKDNEINDRLQGRVAYRASSSHATLRGDEIYDVYSYDTLIAVYSFKKSEWTYFNDVHYSVTTTRLQNMLKRIIGDTTEIERG